MSVAARCQNAIDYTRPVDKRIEQYIHDRLELLDLIRISAIGTTARKVTESNGEPGLRLNYVNKENVDILSSELLPWIGIKKKEDDMKRMASLYRDFFMHK